MKNLTARFPKYTKFWNDVGLQTLGQHLFYNSHPRYILSILEAAFVDVTLTDVNELPVVT